MATAMQRAKLGAQEARVDGKGVGGQAVEGLQNMVTGRDDGLPGNARPGAYGNTGTGTFNNERGVFDHDRDRQGGGILGGLTGHHNGGGLGHTEEEMARLRTKTHITGEGDAYCPNPNVRDLPKEFETRVQVIQRYPEMKTVEKTDFVKEIHHEERFVVVQRTRVIHDDIERIDRVPVVRQMPKTRIEVTYRVVPEEREVFDMVQQVEYVDVPRIEMVPRIITEDVEERVMVPTVVEVPVTRMVEVPTGNYCEAPVGSFVTPGDFNLAHEHGHLGGAGLGTGASHGLGTGHGTHTGAGVGTGLGAGAGAGAGLLHRSKSSSSSISSSDEEESVDYAGGTLPDGTTGVAPGGRRKKKSLLRRVMHK